MELASFVTPADKARHHDSFGNDYSPSLNWYRRGIANLGVAEEITLLGKGEIKAKLEQDTLFVGGMKDAIFPPQRGRAIMAMATEESRLKAVDMDAGHWIMLEQPDELNRALEEFIN
jgi:soluble epoxide hydrolase/lipid-phosphate phosphatase